MVFVLCVLCTITKCTLCLYVSGVDGSIILSSLSCVCYCRSIFFFIVVVVVSPPLTIVKFESSFLRPAFFQIVNSFLHFVHF